MSRRMQLRNASNERASRKAYAPAPSSEHSSTASIASVGLLSEACGGGGAGGGAGGGGGDASGDAALE